MKKFISIFALLSFFPSAGSGGEAIRIGMANSQVVANPTWNASMTKLCGGPMLPEDAPEFVLAKNQVDRIAGANLQLQAGSGIENVAVLVCESPEINARTYFASSAGNSGGVIAIPSGIVRFYADAPEELAFIIAHEMGHALDDHCRAFMASPNKGQNPGGEQECESRADAFGLAIVIRAGYSPYAAAGAFGRLEMLSGDTSTGILARLRGISGDHPMTPDRISNMRRLLAAQQGK